MFTVLVYIHLFIIFLTFCSRNFIKYLEQWTFTLSYNFKIYKQFDKTIPKTFSEAENLHKIFKLNHKKICISLKILTC